jgi:translation machinery-associated protein 16
VDRVAFLQTATSNATSPLTVPEIQDLIEIYVGRFDLDLDALKAERRPGRPASPREAELKLQQEHDLKEYASGYWIPDLEDADVLATLKEWGGSWVALNTMKFVRIAKDGSRLESSFPPKGRS